MPSFRLSITPRKSAGGRFIALVRRELQKALAEERETRGLTQAEIARMLEVHRSVINRQLSGVENITLSRVGELAYALGREASFTLRKPERAKGANHVAAPELSVISGTTAKTTGGSFASETRRVETAKKIA